jgi:hypothetical protein
MNIELNLDYIDQELEEHKLMNNHFHHRIVKLDSENKVFVDYTENFVHKNNHNEQISQLLPVAMDDDCMLYWKNNR